MSNSATAQILPGTASDLLDEEIGDAVATGEHFLSGLSPRQEAVIESVDTDSPIGRRLLDLGFIKGSVVRVVRRAPLRDPVEYEIRGTRICLRRSESNLIRVRQVTKP